jgi:hypothetical protein
LTLTRFHEYQMGKDLAKYDPGDTQWSGFCFLERKRRGECSRSCSGGRLACRGNTAGSVLSCPPPSLSTPIVEGYPHNPQSAEQPVSVGHQDRYSLAPAVPVRRPLCPSLLPPEHSPRRKVCDPHPDNRLRSRPLALPFGLERQGNPAYQWQFRGSYCSFQVARLPDVFWGRRWPHRMDGRSSRC